MIHFLIYLSVLTFLPCEKDLEGNWSLISWQANTGGKNTYPYGENAFGYLRYDPDGTMTLMLMKEGRNMDDFESASGFFTYRANYEVNCSGGVVRHEVFAGSHPDWIGKTQERYFTLRADTLVLQSPLLKTNSTGNQEAVHTLKWIRSD